MAKEENWGLGGIVPTVAGNAAVASVMLNIGSANSPASIFHKLSPEEIEGRYVMSIGEVKGGAAVPHVGDTVQVRWTGQAEAGLGAFSFVLRYDPKKIVAKAVVGEGFQGGQFSVWAVNLLEGEVRIAAGQASKIPGPVDSGLFSLVVEAMDRGWTRITCEGELMDADGGKIDYDEAGASSVVWVR